MLYFTYTHIFKELQQGVDSLKKAFLLSPANVKIEKFWTKLLQTIFFSSLVKYNVLRLLFAFTVSWFTAIAGFDVVCMTELTKHAESINVN